MDYSLVLLLSLVAGSLAGELYTFFLKLILYQFLFNRFSQNFHLLSLAYEALQERKIGIIFRIKFHQPDI